MNDSILIGLREALLSRTTLDALPDSVSRRTAALNTWGTNAIEGNTLTWRDVERLLLQGRSVANRPVADVLETIQHEAAFRGLLDRRAAPIRIVTAMELHEAVFKGITPDAGQWRRVNVRIVGAKHTPPRMEKVIERMAAWEREYAHRDLLGEPEFALGAWMHVQFEAVHPFSDGNGRVGRLLLNLHFLKHSWPPVHVLPPDRERYLRCFDAADAGDLSAFEAFLRVQMARSLVDLLDQVGTKEDALRPLRAFMRGGPYSAKYLALRAGQGHLAAVKASGDWHTSARALKLYRNTLGRRKA